ncbi:hypothetical protein CHS0354_016730 [Potamilus streckersoni]|uniref:NTR domain-containing protein n=1 Tax=Potamilus streckersoni TaxID=2493646 RepID=A0AAE0TCG7_9BIVA|nr:hypothetical protein CHS0354_016730 [Potamilus streckersoni]
MEKPAIFLLSLFVLLVVKHGTSVTSCECEGDYSFCAAGITVVQVKVLGSSLVNSKQVYQLQLIRLVRKGSNQLNLKNNIFQMSYPQQGACDTAVKSKTGKEAIFAGHVDTHGQFAKLVCYKTLRSRGEDNYEVLDTYESIEAYCNAISKG